MAVNFSIDSFIKHYPNYEVVDEKFGDGKKPIVLGFNEHRRIGCKYLIFVDSSENIYDMHSTIEEIENYLIENYGYFDRHEDFNEEKAEHPDLDFDDWFFEQFPKVDIQGGSSNWYEV